MRIGHLHLFIPQDHESGVTRYGRYLASAIAQLPEVEVQQADVILQSGFTFTRDLMCALQTFKTCDVLHFQYSKYMGLTGWQKLWLLHQIRREFSGKLCVTLHDIYPNLYPPYGLQKAWKFENKRFRKLSNHQSLALRSTLTFLWQNHLPDKVIMRWLLKHVDQLLVCTQTEAKRLQHFDQAERIKVLPHFSEDRPQVPDRLSARQKLGWKADEKVVTLQGFVYRTKGHSLLLDAMSLLADDVRVVFAGGMAPNQEAYERELNEQIKRLGLSERFQITGYLSEAELELYLAASDLGVCPYRSTSASGSIATWISMRRPILAYDLPQVQELNARVPQAIQTFKDYTPECLAEAIQLCLDQDLTDAMQRVELLQSKLSLGTIARAHVEAYQAESSVLVEGRGCREAIA